MAISEVKKFVITHIFTDVMNMKFGDDYEGPKEYHFRFPWRMRIRRKNENFVVQLHLWMPRREISDWYRILFATRFISITSLAMNTEGRWYCTTSKSWDDDFEPVEVKYCLIDGNLQVDMHVETSKIELMKELRSFDESMKKFSDVVLVVKNEKFYVLKKYLAAHCTYFKSLFSQSINASDHTEIELEGIEPYDLQSFLEVLYGEDSIYNNSVWRIIHLAEMYGSMTICRRCKEDDCYKYDKEIQTRMVQLEKKYQRPLGFLFGGKKLGNFDKSMKKYSDVLLVVEGRKFYVLKKYLASHSAYFNSLFMGGFGESGQSKITLKNIDPFDFRNFLEVIYGEPVIDDDNIEGILDLADMYGSETAIRRCAEFLIKPSKRTLEDKLALADKYYMDKQAIKGMKRAERLKPVIFSPTSRTYKVDNTDGTYPNTNGTYTKYTKTFFGFPGFIFGFCVRKFRNAWNG